MKTGIAVAESIGESAQKLYLCGFSLDKYIVTDAFIRLGGWLNNGHCWVTAALGMFLLRHNDTAKLCKGICQRHNRNGGGGPVFTTGLSSMPKIVTMFWIYAGLEAFATAKLTIKI